ncbi:response regulator receiver domain-containing protein [Candidatus Magnetomorum sp. HK-1]|nr:response regulator receiver domain-containing protein [Candidatus Magnetomorum sp. HK-1]
MDKEKYRIFVVDDEADTAELIASSVSALTDHTVISFDSPQLAIDSYMKKPSDLVITDLNMPNIDGFEMIQKLKNRNLNTDFIIITGDRNIQSVVHARWLGVSYLYFKPVNIDEVIKAVETMYNRACYWEDRLKEVKRTKG